MIVDVPFEYFCLLAFKVIIQFENKRSINMKRLFKYIDALTFLTLQDYEIGDNQIPGEEWTGEVSIRAMDYYDELLEVVDKTNGIFSFDGDILSIDDKITLKEIDELIRQFKVSDRFIYISTCNECLEALGATSIKKVICQYMNTEVDLFDEYMKLVDRENDDLIIKNIMMKRMFFINVVNMFSKEVVMAFYHWAVNLSQLDEDEDEQKFPINYKLYRNSDYYDAYYDMGSWLLAKSGFIYAILGKDCLANEAIIQIIEEIYDVKEDLDFDKERENDEEFDDEWYDENEDDFDELESDSYGSFENICDCEEEKVFIPHILDEEVLFYMNYVDKINDYFKKYGYNRELNVTKYRLLFVLDKPDWCLYDSQKFEEILDRMMVNGYQEEIIFDLFGNHAKYFITEVFGNQNKDSDVAIIKKLLFVHCYYDMTKDDEVRSILEKYCGYENFDLFSEIILGDDCGYVRRRELN